MEPLAYLFVAVFSIVIGKLVYNWYAEIEKRNRYMEAQIKLLAQIASANGINQDKIAEILVEATKGKKPKA